MKIFFLYFYLFAFWAENSLGFKLTNIPGLSLFNLSFYMLILVWAYSIIFKIRLLRWNEINFYLVLLIFAVIFSIPYKLFIEDLPYAYLKYELIALKVWANPFLVFFIVFNLIDDEETCKRALLGLIILLFITALSTPLISLKIIGIGKTYFFYHGRAAGFAEPNQYAGYLVLFIPLILAYVLFEKHAYIRVASIFVLLVVFIALVTTGSRGGIFAFLGSVIFYLYVLTRKKMIQLPTLIATVSTMFIIGAVSFAAAPSAVKETVSYRLNPAHSENLEDYMGGRLKAWRSGFKLFSERPVFGYGLRTFIKLMEKEFGKRLAAHNQVLNYLVQFGLIGAILFILVFYKIFQIMWNYQKSMLDPWEKKLLISYIAGLLGYIIYIFWFYTAVFLRYSHLRGKIQE
jgi:oligosaccharide repeat unit polymerase